MPLSSSRLAAVLVLLASAGTLRAGESATDLLSLVPADSVAVVSVRWSEIRASEMYQSCEERFLVGQEGMGIREFVALTGLDPVRDIDSLVLAVRGRDGTSERRGAVGLVTGHFDEGRLVAAIAAKGARLERRTDAGMTSYRVLDETPGEHAPVLAFASPTLAVFGDQASVSAALDAAAGRGARPGADSELRQALARSSHAGHAWGAVALSTLLPELPELNREASRTPLPVAALKSLRWATFDVSFGRELDLTIQAQARSAEDAESVRQAADGLLALARLGAKEDPEVLAALAETELTRAGEQITLHTTVSEDLLEQLHRRPSEPSRGLRNR